MADSWGNFLTVRRQLIREMRDEGKSCTEIAATLSMDPGQVWLINADRENACPDDARDAVLKHRADVMRRLT
jgi:hypothetical protein